VTMDQLDLTRRPQSVSSIFALVNAKVGISKEQTTMTVTQATVTGRGGSSTTTRVTSTTTTVTTVYNSPLADVSKQRQILPMLLDQCTTRQATSIPARVNVMTAPTAVLTALPGLQDTDVQTIMNVRPPASQTDPTDLLYQTSAWLLTEANIKASTLQALERYITGRTQVYRVQSVGYFDSGGPTARIEAVIDTNGGQPRIIHWRDLSELGKGYDFSK
jgi:hypothetical protein